MPVSWLEAADLFHLLVTGKSPENYFHFQK